MKIIGIVGARPNFMKIAPLVREFATHPEINHFLCHTGQHYDPVLSDIFFEELRIPKPNVSLGVGSLPRLEQMAKIEQLFEPVIVKEKPDILLVVGDVNSTIACARVAKKHGVKVAHVEAGLRSFDQEMPEEHNRIETDRLSDFLYITEESGLKNLAREQNAGERLLVGNVMIDTLVHDLPRAKASKKKDDLGLKDGRYFVATFHRPSNVDTKDMLEGLVETIKEIAAVDPLVLPLHPRTRASLERFGLLGVLKSIPGLIVCEPLGYTDFIGLIQSSKAVITDSGGIQEETTYLGIPCLTMRENTERPVTVDVGTNVLIGSSRQRLREELERISLGTFKKGAIPPLWDGRAAERIVAHLLRCVA